MRPAKRVFAESVVGIPGGVRFSTGAARGAERTQVERRSVVRILAETMMGCDVQMDNVELLAEGLKI